MKLFSSVRQLALTATLASGVILGAIAPSEACPFSKTKGMDFNADSPLKTDLANLNLSSWVVLQQQECYPVKALLKVHLMSGKLKNSPFMFLLKL